MLLSIEHHQELLNVGWEIRRIENKPYYIKHIFKEKEYMILITDLCLVWFEHGNFKRIQQNARIPNIDIETEKESMTLLVRVKKLFLDKNNVRTLIQKKSNQLLVHCKPVVNQYRRNEQYNIVNAFLWIFHCDLLDQQGTNDKFKSGPQIIFEHFIQPIQAIVNYFTENLSDDNYTKINMEKSSFSVYSTTSLDYMSKLVHDSSNLSTLSTAIQESLTNSEKENEETVPIIEDNLELKHKRGLQLLAEEARQRNPLYNKKRKRL